jgi:hypothetical protein
LQSEAALAWGNEGHTAINRVAAEKIPATMPRFLRRAVVEIAYLGPEPDRWRSPSEFALKNAQEPDHFIDLERVVVARSAAAGPLRVLSQALREARCDGRARITLTIICRSTSGCSPISRWKCMGA